MNTERRDNRQTLKGIVTPAKWDVHEKVIGLSVQTTDEEEYLIDPAGKGSEMIELIHEKVRVTGEIRQNRDGRKIIHILTYNTIGGYGER